MHNVIKSHPHTRWVTHTLENYSTTEVSPSGVRALSPMLGSPAQGSSTKKIIPQSIWLSRPAELNCRSLTGLRETETSLLTENTKYHGKSSHLIGTWARLLGRKVMTNLDSILKNRDITLPTKVHLVKAMVFPVVMYGCES